MTLIDKNNKDVDIKFIEFNSLYQDMHPCMLVNADNVEYSVYLFGDKWFTVDGYFSVDTSACMTELYNSELIESATKAVNSIESKLTSLEERLDSATQTDKIRRLKNLQASADSLIRSAEAIVDSIAEEITLVERSAVRHAS